MIFTDESQTTSELYQISYLKDLDIRAKRCPLITRTW